MPIVDLRGRGTPVFVLLHGAPGDRAQMAPLVPHLEAHGRVALVEALDSGASADLLTSDPEDLVTDAHAIVESFAPSPVTLVGFSVGGWVAGRLASTRPPQNLARLVFLAGYAQARPADAELFQQVATELGAKRLPVDATVEIALQRWFPSGARPPGIEQHVHTLCTTLSIDRWVRALTRLAGTARDDRAVGRYDIPAIAVHGRHETAVPLELGEALVAKGSRAALRVLETDAHYLPWSHTAACVDAILAES